VHPNEVRLAELIAGRFASIEQVRFTNSGTEANLMALAVATNHTGRSGVLVFDGGYHGGVLTFAGHRDVNVPHDWIVSTYNDVGAVDSVFADQGGSIAAVLVEPLQGSAGCLPADPAFLRSLRRHCDDSGALLIFDEVMTSRLAPGGMQEVLGITPDLTTLGKYLAGGFTFGAFGGRRGLMAAFDASAGGRLGHAGTFNNNVVSMAAGVATLTEVLTTEVLATTNARGERLRSRLNATFARHGVPMCATGAGSLMNLHGTAGASDLDRRPPLGGRPLEGAAVLRGARRRLLRRPARLHRPVDRDHRRRRRRIPPLRRHLGRSCRGCVSGLTIASGV
jgi:glutamate-1-semialdehyde 2,1-aminomutase